MNKTDKHRALLIGCGELGSRHLQAISTLLSICEVDIVDARPGALDLGKQRLSEVKNRNPDIKFRWHTALEQAVRAGDICIVATQAEGRCDIVKRVVDEFDHRFFLLEKVVSQSIAAYGDLCDLAAKENRSIWVNCKTRAYPVYKRVVQYLDPAEPILFNVVAGNHGLANNGIHVVDLFAFLDGCSGMEGVGSSIDPKLLPSKRGDRVFDLSGTLHGRSEKGSRLTVSFAGHHTDPGLFSIAASGYRCIVDEHKRCAWESDAESGWEWRPAPFAGNPFVSSMTRDFVGDILATGRCDLPTLEGCFPAHRFVLSELLPHFNALLNKEDEYCPVT